MRLVQCFAVISPRAKHEIRNKHEASNSNDRNACPGLKHLPFRH